MIKKTYETVNGVKAQVKVERISTYDYKVKETLYFVNSENADIYLDFWDELESKAAFRLFYFRVYNKLGRSWVEEL